MLCKKLEIPGKSPRICTIKDFSYFHKQQKIETSYTSITKMTKQTYGMPCLVKNKFVDYCTCQTVSLFSSQNAN